METATTSIVDIDLKVGANDKGDWTLCTATGADRNKYKTFDDALTAQCKQALKSKVPIRIIFEAKQKEYNGKSYTERTIKSINPQSADAPPAKAATSSAPAGKGSQLPPEYWEKKDRLDFQRTAHMSALKASAELMVALINAKVESYKFEDALMIVTREADRIYASYFKAYEKEGTSNVQPTTAANDAAAGDAEYADEYERVSDAQ